jgi:hypothetical protein
MSSEEYRALRENETNYWLAGRLQKHMSEPAAEILLSMQRSTWEAYNMLDYEKYLRYARETIAFIDAMKMPSDENIFLKGELYRRTGNFKEAEKIFRKLQKSVAGDQSMTKKIKQQLGLIEAQITSTQRTER